MININITINICKINTITLQNMYYVVAIASALKILWDCTKINEAHYIIFPTKIQVTWKWLK